MGERLGGERGRELRDDIIFALNGREEEVNHDSPGLSCCGQVRGQLAPALAWV